MLLWWNVAFLSFIHFAFGADSFFSLPRVVVTFLAPQGLTLPDIWDTWINNAIISLNDLDLEYIPKPLDCGSFDSQVLVPVVSVRDDADLNNTTRFPCWLKDRAIVQPSDAAWGNLLPVFHSVLTALQPSSTSTTHYIFVSETSIPTAEFVDILTELTADPRSHFDMWRENFSPCLSKTSGWFSLSQRHADMLLASPHIWYNDRKMYSHAQMYAASDEVRPFGALLELETTSQTKNSWLPTLRGFLRICSKPNFWPDTLSVRGDSERPFWGVHSVFWYQLPVTRRGFVGGGTTSSKHPLEYSRVNGYYLRFLMEKTWTWFARKFTLDSMVTHCTNATETNFLVDWMGLSDSEERESWPRPTKPGFWQRLILGEPKQFKLDPNKEGSGVCSISDFCRKRESVLPY